MKIEIEIPDTVELDGIADEDMQRMIQAAVCTDHWYEYSGADIDLSAASVKVVDSAWTRKPARSFLAWLKAQPKRDDVVGDLARDVARDPRAPSGRATKGQWRDHLGGSQCLAVALSEAWAEFLNAE
jgi:hypothetical protein